MTKIELCLLAMAVVAAAGSFRLGRASAQPASDAAGYDQADLDPAVSPGTDFYDYATGGWQKANPIPPEYPSWGTFVVLYKENLDRTHKILEEAAADAAAPKGSERQKIGDFYYSGMDTVQIEINGYKPLRNELDRIESMRTPDDLRSEIAHLQRMGVRAAFDFESMQDYKNSSQVIGSVSQGGLGLPNRDYYTKDDDKSKDIREKYVAHVAAMLQLIDESPEQAKKDADTIMAMETAMAGASMRPVEMRDPEATYHPMTVKELAALTPDFSWPGYFGDLGRPGLESINVATPDFFKQFNTLLGERPMADWKTYLRWKLVASAGPYLSSPFVDEGFKFRSQLTGAEKLQDRWERVVGGENWLLGFAVGKEYVKEYFPPESKARVLAILKNIKGALAADLDTLSWMDAPTRKAAQKKLSMIEDKIGYPDKWRDYSKLTIDRGPYVLNAMRAREFATARDLDKIGKPVDRSEWFMPPQTVNAYYDPSNNEIVFPAGILQPPFFNPDAPEALNYGAAGMVMGHEITHGFDDQGAKFDGEGNLKNWWSPEDLKRFQAASKCIADQYSTYVVDGDAHVQGDLVTGEAIADLGGMKLAYHAFKAWEAKNPQPEMTGGFTPDQLFFLGFARVWATNTRPEAQRMRVMTDPHPPSKFRVNGTVANMPEFAKAFNLPADSPIMSKNRCVIW